MLQVKDLGKANKTNKPSVAAFKFNSLDMVVLAPEEDAKVSLYDLIRQFESGQLKTPPHQRNFVWTEDKIKAWVETILKTATGERLSPPLGAMVTYQIIGTGDYFLNDGFQRITATRKFLEAPRKYAPPRYKQITNEDAVRAVQAYKIMVQHRHYETTTDAMYWFQVLQLGTPLTAYEFCKGYLEYLESDTDWWPTLQDLHKFMETSVNQVAAPIRPPTPSAIHAAMRHNYALFYIWLCRYGNRSLPYAPIAAKQLSLRDAELGKMVEQKLGAQLLESGLGKILSELKTFQIFIEEESRTIQEVWASVPKRSATRPSYTLYRWLLMVALWRRNNKLSRDATWFDFLRLVFLHCHGSTGHITKVNEDGTVKSIIIGLDKVGRIGEVCDLIGHVPYRTAASYKAYKPK